MLFNDFQYFSMLFKVLNLKTLRNLRFNQTFKIVMPTKGSVLLPGVSISNKMHKTISLSDIIYIKINFAFHIQIHCIF
jgi:hypothetical protein